MPQYKTWAIVGASRGLGHEFVKQLLSKGEHVYATTRDSSHQAANLWPEHPDPSSLTVLDCDMLSEARIDAFAHAIARKTSRIDYLVLNAGVLRYPNRASEISYDQLVLHFHTNTIGPIICAQRLLKCNISIGTIVFVSSDSGSAQRFREEEDGFAAYAASKAALNQMLRHMAAELKRKGSNTTIIAIHPGEVDTDMAKIEISWDLGCQSLTPAESVTACIPVIESKGPDDSGTFWTWKNEVGLAD